MYAANRLNKHYNNNKKHRTWLLSMDEQIDRYREEIKSRDFFGQGYFHKKFQKILSFFLFPLSLIDSQED